MRAVDHLALGIGSLRRRKLRSFLTISAVVVGAMSVIVMLTLVLSAKAAIVRQLRAMDALTVVAVSGKSGSEGSNARRLGDRAVERLGRIEHVVGAGPVASVPVRGLTRSGTTVRARSNVVTVSSAMTIPLSAGREPRPNEMASIVLGARSARALGHRDGASLIGRTIRLLMEGAGAYNDWTGDPPPPPPGADRRYWERVGATVRPVKVRVVGIAAPMPLEDQSFVSLAWAQKLQTVRRWEFAAGGAPTVVREDLIAREGYATILLRIESTEHVAAVASAVEDLGFGAATAQQLLDGLARFFLILGLIAGAIGGITLFVASIGIVNTMVMATLERTREVGVMRALGASRAVVRRMFAVEASMIGLCGGAIALAGSLALAKAGNLLLNRLAESKSLPVADLISFPAWLVAGVLGLTTIVGLVAGIYPAHRAARLEPVEALRYE